MKIRAAKLWDAEAIAGVWNQIILKTDKTFNSIEVKPSDITAMIAEKGREGHPLIVAERNGILGFATYGQFRSSVGYARTMEHTIIVRDGAQRSGVGRMLMERIEEIAKTNNVHSLVAGISGTNNAAILFHRAQGFVQVGRMPEVGYKFGRWHDLVLMQKMVAELPQDARSSASRKSIWSQLLEFFTGPKATAGRSDSSSRREMPREHSASFMIAIICLGAKIAKADGLVTKDEVTAFRKIFIIGEADAPLAAKVYNYAKRSAVGYEQYAKRVARHFGPGNRMLDLILEGLFVIADADGTISQAEADVLRKIGQIFGVPEKNFANLMNRFGYEKRDSPYDILDVHPDMPTEEIKARWRALAKENHPDVLTAKGMPKEAVKLAEIRMASINRAWEQIKSERE